MPVYFTNTHELLAAVCLILEVASALTVAFVLAPRLAERTPLDRLLVGALITISFPVGVSLVAGMIGVLRLPVLVAAQVVIAAAVLTWSLRHPKAAVDDDGSANGLGALDVVAIGSTLAYLGLGLFYSIKAQPSGDFDTAEYHISNLSSWLQRGMIWHLPYAQPGSFTATHPSNGELLGLWVAITSHSDELVYAIPLVFAALAIIGCAVLARELTQDRRAAPLGALAALAVLCSPIGFYSQVDTLETDLAAGAGLIVALALVLVARRASATRTVALAGVALGLGIGSKYTAFIPGALIALGAIVLLRRSRVWWWLVPGVAVLAAPWFVRNLVDTGNPLFPEALGPIRGANTPYAILSTPILHHILAGRTSILHTWATLAEHLVGPVLIFIAIGCVVAVWRGEDRIVSLVALVITAGAFIGYLATPYSGGGVTGLGFVIGSALRYGTIALLLGATVAAAALGVRAGAALVGLVLVWDVWRIHAPPPNIRNVIVTNTALVGALVLGAIVAAVLFATRSSGWFDTVTRRLHGWPSAALAAVVAIVAIGGVFAELHHVDRGRSQTPLEDALLGYGPKQPVIDLGVENLRTLLGPELARPLVEVWRGGRGHEIPFTDTNQMRRLELGDKTAPPEPSSFGPGLDRALLAAKPDLLVTSAANPAAFPVGWHPTTAWCKAFSDYEGTLYVRASVEPGGRCPVATTTPAA